MWRVSSSADRGRWVQNDAGRITADPQSQTLMTKHAGQPVSYGALAGVYQPSSATDQVGLFLLARSVVPEPHVVSGEPPKITPLSAGPVPDDAVF